MTKSNDLSICLVQIHEETAVSTIAATGETGQGEAGGGGLGGRWGEGEDAKRSVNRGCNFVWYFKHLCIRVYSLAVIDVHIKHYQPP